MIRRIVSLRRSRRRTLLRSTIGALLNAYTPIAVDIGASGDVPEPWLDLEGNARFICIEPDDAACEQMKKTYAARGAGEDYQVFPVALSRDGGERTLYVTASPTGSSLFNPDNDLVKAYTTSEYLLPITSRTVKTRASGEFFDSIGLTRIDLLKLDVQGCELEILEGTADATLRGCSLIELEATLHDHGPDYPTFCDIHALMTSKGFALLDLWPDRQPRSYHGRRSVLTSVLNVYDYSPSVSRRIWEIDALYFRPPSTRPAEFDESRLRMHIVSNCLYGFFAEALAAIREGADLGIIDMAKCRALEAGVVRWHALTRYRPWFSRRLPWRYLRRLARLADRLVPYAGADYIHPRKF